MAEKQAQQAPAVRSKRKSKSAKVSLRQKLRDEQALAGAGMSGKWFSNRGQMGQLLVATLALLVGIVIAWPQLSTHMNLLALWPVVVVPLAAYLVFQLGRLSKTRESAPTPQAASTSPPSAARPVDPPGIKLPATVLAEVTEGFGLDPDSIFIEKKTVKMGDYWEIKEGIARLKITPIAFLDDGSERKVPYVELRFDTGGSVFYGGDQAIERSGVNKVALPETSSGFQAEERCAYQFSFSDKHVHFTAVRVDHINQFANEVVIEACAVVLRKTTKL